MIIKILILLVLTFAFLVYICTCIQRITSYLTENLLLVHAHTDLYTTIIVYRNTLWACASRKLFSQATCNSLYHSSLKDQRHRQGNTSVQWGFSLQRLHQNSVNPLTESHDWTPHSKQYRQRSCIGDVKSNADQSNWF